jgi:hypothetical protein
MRFDSGIHLEFREGGPTRMPRKWQHGTGYLPKEVAPACRRWEMLLGRYGAWLNERCVIDSRSAPLPSRGRRAAFSLACRGRPSG